MDLLMQLSSADGETASHAYSTRSSAVAKRPRDASYLYSFNTKRRAQSFIIVVSASGIPLRTIKFFSVLFSSAYSSTLQAVTNKHSLVSRRLWDVHCMVVGNCFWHFARPAIFDSQLLDQNRDFCLYPTCIRHPR